MFSLIIAFALAAPPQSTLPVEAKCQCSANCPCKAPAPSAPTPKQTAEPPVSRWQDIRGDWYETRADGKNYPASTTNSAAQTTSGVVPGGCRVVNGVMVCPTPRR